MQSSLPGFLYAKSLSPGDAPEEGYRTWFLNPALKPHEGRINSLRDSFRWRTDSSRRHAPVVVVEPVADGGHVLVVRFLDAGKDSFGRPQTLRMEALLVPVAIAPALWDGTFEAVPNAGRAEFLVDVGAPCPGFPGLCGKRLVNGDSDSFALGNNAVPRPHRQEDNPMPKSASNPVACGETRNPAGRRVMTKWFLIALAAFLVSLVANVCLYSYYAGKTESLRSRLSQMEREREELCSRLEGLKNEQSALEAFRSQSKAFAEAIEDLKDVAARLDGIRTAVDMVVEEEQGQ